MEKNKTGKHLKYAIGEIILVVLGILIALQINNLNEQRKERNKEQSILSEDYQSNLLQLEQKIEKIVIKLDFRYCSCERNGECMVWIG